MIVLLESDGGLVLRKVGVKERVMARLRSNALDAELAAGAPPESSVALALHAGHVAAPRQRRLLARSLLRIAARSETEAPTPLRAVPLDRDAVRGVRADLESLATRLASEQPVDVRGVAKVRSLLADGTGPLYRPRRSGGLHRELVAVGSALDAAG